MDVIIRSATEQDLGAIGQLGALLVRTHHEFDPQRFMSASPGAARGYGSFIGTQIGRPDAVVLVAVHEGAVAGYVYGTLEPRDWMALRDAAGAVQDIVVDPARRRGGIGRMLITAAMSWMREHGAPRVVLSTASRNEAAQKLFASVGFRQTMIEMTRELTAE